MAQNDLLQSFRDDWGKAGHPLGDLAGVKAIDDRYVVELYENTIYGMTADRGAGDSVVSVFERLDGYEYTPERDNDRPGLYPKRSNCWLGVYRDNFPDAEEARELYDSLTRERIEELREHDRPPEANA